MNCRLRALASPLVFALSPFAWGCGSGLTLVSPSTLAPNELTLRYDSGFEVWSPQGKVAEGVSYEGLADHVYCVPEAHRHAREAEAAGATATGMTISGVVLAVGGLGGLSGLAYQDEPDTMAAIFITGITVEVIGLVLAAVGRSYKTDANGHAVDAVNYYNDSVGSQGRSCAER